MKVIEVKVKTNARLSALTQSEDGTWNAQLKSLPIDGKANLELIGLISKEFKCKKSSISIKSGMTSKNKLIQITD